MEYKAFREGPIPAEFVLDEWNAPGEDLLELFAIEHRDLPDGKTCVALRPRKGAKFDRQYFTSFQIELMEQLATKYFKHNAQQMSDESHSEAGIWHQVWSVEGRKQGEIPYDYALHRKGTDDDLALLKFAKEREAFLQSLEK